MKHKRAAPRLLSVLLSGLLCTAAACAATPESKTVWITVGDAAYAELQKVAPQAIARESQLTQSGEAGTRFAATEKIHLVEVNEEQLLKLSSAIHHELKRCGGFMFHSSETAGRTALTAPVNKGLLAAARPAYVIDNQSLVTPVLSQMQDSNIGQTIVDLSAFANRYYTTTNGANASNWLKQKWSTMAAGRADITVTQFAHTGYNQKSVILTINGTDNAAEVVVLGGHLDSINGNGTGETTKAPGADDDASGIASLTEALRSIVATGYKPRRTIKLIGYAAEEVGLRGSQDIAKNFKANNVNVVGVMQLDMTNYKGSPSDIYIYTDYTDSLQNDFLVKLITTYLPTLSVGYDKCGYGCSDHASWTAQGYAASLPFETSFNQDNPYIHTANDTYANSGNQAAHALKFARLAAAYAIELGSDGPGVVPPPDTVQTLSGSLNRGQSKTFGPYKVGAGGNFKASMTGTGDTDLYLRKSAVPTTTTSDCKSESSSSTETCSLSLAANGDVYVLVYGYTASTYNLTVTYRPQ
ncbi:MAG: M20/M25/M40 family metallo-hydrolase [Pseudomonadota bacterium]